MERIANLTGAVMAVYGRLWTAVYRELDPEFVSAVVQGAQAHRVCVADWRVGGCLTVNPVINVSVQVGRLLYRAVDPNFISAVARGIVQAYDFFNVFKYVIPWVAPWIVGLVRYIRQPAFPKQPRHATARSYSLMAERAGELQRKHQARDILHFRSTETMGMVANYST